MINEVNLKEFEVVYNYGKVSLRKQERFDYCMDLSKFNCPEFVFNEKIAAIVHIFYLDTLEVIINYINLIPAVVDLYITTDTMEKQKIIEAKLHQIYSKGAITIKVCQNRGRDVAPMLIEFKEVFDVYKYFIHLHSKKSLQLEYGDQWLKHILDSLLFNENYIKAILWQLSVEKVGVVFSEHFWKMDRTWISYGANYYLMLSLLKKLGLNAHIPGYIDFPSGTMFWGRTSVMKKLSALNLSYENFPPENGQTDMTLAHVIERIILFLCEDAGLSWNKLAIRRFYKGNAGTMNRILEVLNESDYSEAHKKVFIPVLENYAEVFKKYGVKKNLVSMIGDFIKCKLISNLKL